MMLTNNIKYMKSKNRNDVILMNLRWDKAMLKVFQKRTNYLGYMGIPGKRQDEHYLFPEEAVFLAENNSALIYLDGKILPLSAIFTVLRKFGISLMKYAAFVHLLRAGYIVRRASFVEPILENITSFPSTSKVFHQPFELLEKFPGFSQDGNSLVIPPAVCQTPILGMPDLSNRPKIEQLSKLIMDLQNLSKMRPGYDPWTRCRPGYWPSFESLKSSENWHIYSRNKQRLQKYSIEQQDAIKGVKKSSIPKYDFDVYANDGAYTHTKQLAPLYRLLVIDERYVNKIPSTVELSMLARASPIELLIASGDPGHLRIVKCNGDPLLI